MTVLGITPVTGAPTLVILLVEFWGRQRYPPSKDKECYVLLWLPSFFGGEPRLLSMF
jgi:hypothetical protein